MYPPKNLAPNHLWHIVPAVAVAGHLRERHVSQQNESCSTFNLHVIRLGTTGIISIWLVPSIGVLFVGLFGIHPLFINQPGIKGQPWFHLWSSSTFRFYWDFYLRHGRCFTMPSPGRWSVYPVGEDPQVTTNNIQQLDMLCMYDI